MRLLAYVTVLITSLSVAPWCSQAQQTARTMVVLASKTVDTTLAVRRKIDPSFLANVLAQIRLTSPERDALQESMLDLLRQENVDSASVEAVLRKTGLPTTVAGALTGSLLTYMRTPDPNDQASFFSAAAGAGATDRLYSSVEIFNFSVEHFAARVVAATAVSNADTTLLTQDTVALQKRDSYRQRTSRVLTALYDGGPLAVHVQAQAGHERKNGKGGFSASLVGTLAKSGTLSTARDALWGGAGEIRLYARRAQRVVDQKPAEVSATLRFGLRRTIGASLLGDESTENVLLFGQAMFEGRTAGSKIPIGITLTRANTPFGSYLPTIQVFGIAGF